MGNSLGAGTAVSGDGDGVVAGTGTGCCPGKGTTKLRTDNRIPRRQFHLLAWEIFGDPWFASFISSFLATRLFIA